MRQVSIRIITAALASLGIVFAAGADTITLKGAARLSPGAAAVTLADVAELDGPDAQSLGKVEIAKAPQSAVEISVRDVRARLEQAGANWARINLSGRSVTVRPARAGDAAAPLAMSAASIDAKQTPPKAETKTPQPKLKEFPAGDLLNAGTLRGVIAGLITTNVSCETEDLRLGFDPGDEEFLNAPTTKARFEVEAQSDFTGDRIQLGIRVWEGERIRQTRTVNVWPTMRVRTSVLKNDVRCNQTISEGDVEVSQEWLPPSQASQRASRVGAIGRIATKGLKAGDTLSESHLHRSVLVKRGDQVMVRCLVGGVAISLQAEAKADGGEGDTIEFRKPGDKQTFLAMVTARGEAVVDLKK